MIDSSRKNAIAAERAEVAALVSEYLDRSGLTRADFAERIGTSSSRLSTYLKGRVAPSSTLLLRMRRVARASADNRGRAREKRGRSAAARG